MPTSSPSASPKPGATVAFNDWTTYGYDNARDGFNPNTAAFTPTSLAQLHLAWKTSIPNGFNTLSQPVLASNVGSHAGLLFVGGGTGIEYAYDALTGAEVWSRSFGQETFACDGSNVPFGIGGTAAYDSTNHVLYVSSNVNNGTAGAPAQNYINELNVADGSLVASTNITPNPLAGEVDFSHTALTLANGLVYAGTGSTCDISSWRGRVAAVNAGGMTLANTFFTAYDQGQGDTSSAALSGGGVWGWGGVSIDPSGNVWTAVGNIDVTSGSNGPQAPFVQTTDEHAAFGEHVVQISPDLSTPLQKNYPGFQYGGSSVDLDISGTPVIGSPMGCDTMAAVQGKSGYLYLYDTTGISNGPVSSFKFTSSSYNDPNLGNPGFSPLTGLFYASQSTGVSGGVEPAPGMLAISGCGASSSIAWHTAFGPDSSVSGGTRSMPTITAGGVVFVATPCDRDSNGGCTGTDGKYGGALWALDANSGVLLNGGTPLITCGSTIRMGATVDGDWLYVIDNGGALYAMTLDPSFPAISNNVRVKPALHPYVWR